METDGRVARGVGAGAERAPEPARRGARPRRVGLLDAAAGLPGVPSGWLLGDLADALLAYERMAAHELGEPPAPPELVRLADTAGDDGPQARDGRPEGLDALVACLAAPDAAGHEAPACEPGAGTTGELPGCLADALAGLQPGAPVYGVLLARDRDPLDACPALTPLAGACADRGLTWAGGLAVGGHEVLACLAHQPRMGILRRPVSEATDLLVHALRAGVAVRAWDASSTQVAGSDVLLCSPGVPGPAWGLARRIAARRGGTGGGDAA